MDRLTALLQEDAHLEHAAVRALAADPRATSATGASGRGSGAVGRGCSRSWPTGRRRSRSTSPRPMAASSPGRSRCSSCRAIASAASRSSSTPRGSSRCSAYRRGSPPEPRPRGSRPTGRQGPTARRARRRVEQEDITAEPSCDEGQARQRVECRRSGSGIARTSQTSSTGPPPRGWRADPHRLDARLGSAASAISRTASRCSTGRRAGVGRRDADALAKGRGPFCPRGWGRRRQRNGPPAPPI